MSNTFSTLLLALALGAPVPRARPLPPRPPLVGRWHLTWGSSGGPAGFAPDGYCEYRWAGATYRAIWELRGDTLLLRHEGRLGEKLDWEVVLERGRLAGKTAGWSEMEFRLEREK